nr:testis development-related protein isoform X2 [Macaca nemestrina]
MDFIVSNMLLIIRYFDFRNEKIVQNHLFTVNKIISSQKSTLVEVRAKVIVSMEVLTLKGSGRVVPGDLGEAPLLGDLVTAFSKVQGASFRGWKEVTSLFNKDDEQHLLERCKSPKSKGTNLRLKEELKAEKKSGFWDNLVLKQNIQSKKPDEIEGWEPPKLALEDISADPEDTMGGHPSWSGWEDDTKGSTKYTSLASSANSSRWSLRSAGRLRLSVVPSLCFLRAVSWYLFCKQRARDVAHDVGQVPAVLPLRSRKEVTAVKMQGSCECDSCHSPSPSP